MFSKSMIMSGISMLSLLFVTHPLVGSEHKKCQKKKTSYYECRESCSKQKDIVSTAQSAGQFKVLLAAAKAAGLVDALKSEGPLTVFAPTDDAFSQLPKGTIANLLKPENKNQLASILKYHVVSGKVSARDFVKASSAKTLLGQTIKSDIKDGQVMVNDSKLIGTDICTSNGVIHIIDKVLLPKNNGKPMIGVNITHSSSKGVFISPIEGYGAATAGIHSGDQLIYLNKTVVKSKTDIQKFLSNKKSGDTITMGVIRGSKGLMNFEVTLQ